MMPASMPHILLVEDDVAHIDLIRRAMASATAPVHLSAVRSLREAHTVLASCVPDLLLVDWRLPDGHGLTLLASAQDVPRYPVVLMTSYGNEQVAVEAMKAGAVDYVVKSAATLADMPTIVERALRQWQHIVARQQAEERFAKAFDASPAPMGITRLADARLLAVNEAFLRATGYTREEVVGHTTLELHWWVRLEDRQRFFEEFQVHRYVRNFPVQRRNKSGEIREVLLSAERIDFAGVPCVLTSTFDITERHRLEKALHQAERLASLGTLAAGLAHELNQPLTAIRVTVDSMLYGLQRGWTVSEERLADSLRLISEQCQRTAAILEDVRLFARDHAGHQQSSSSLHEGLERVLRLLGTQLAVHNITLLQHIPPELPHLAIPQARLEQVLINILSNARQALDSIERPAKTIELTAVQEDRTVVLRVQDNGPGIAPEHRARLFDPFFTTKEPGEGTGLGLSIVHGLVTEAGGELSVAEAPTGGAVFLIRLPTVED